MDDTWVLTHDTEDYIYLMETITDSIYVELIKMNERLSLHGFIIMINTLWQPHRQQYLFSTPESTYTQVATIYDRWQQISLLSLR